MHFLPQHSSSGPSGWEPRSLETVNGYCKKLIKYHDELADLKSYFDGVRLSSNPNPDSSNLCSTSNYNTLETLDDELPM